MNDLPSREATPALLRWGRAIHRALMPDYNRTVATYWWLAVLAGIATLLSSIVSMAEHPPVAWVHTAIGTGIAMVAGFFPVRLRGSKNSFVAGEIFIFLLMLIHGPCAAVIAAAAEGFAGSYRSSKRWTSRIFSPAIAAVAMLIASSVFEWFVGDRPSRNPGVLIVASMAFGLGYFLCNTLAVAAVPRLKAGQRLQWSDFFVVFGWIGIAYSGTAAVSALLYLTYVNSGGGVLLAMVPLLAMMLATLHYFFRQQEAAEAVRLAAVDAQEREQELAARHVRELEASERRFHSAFTHASIGMALMSFEGRFLQANPALCALLGRDIEALLHQRIHDLVLVDDRPRLTEQLGLVRTGAFETFELELRCHHTSGAAVWVLAHCSYFSEPGATSPSLILQVQDITARRKAEEGLHHIAFHDALTGLPNRRRFNEHLTQAVTAAVAQPDDEAFAVMFLDFDRFKLINDSLGHNAGDEFLVQVSQRIRNCLRPSDIVARLGGDEFAVLVRQLGHERDAVALAERVMEAMRKPFFVANTELMTSASIGITFSVLGYSSPEDVLRDADTAMYKAKAAGKARYALFDASLHTEVASRLRLEGDLRRAIDEGRLTVAYQPIWDMAGNHGQGRISGFEALVRWHHPQDGPISPAAFLPIAEEAGLMLRLTDFVMHCAARQLRQWQESDPAFANLKMNVNVSGHDIAHAAFVARVTRAIVEAGLQPRHLCIELTENILMSRLEGALPVLGELRRLGVTLAIDDFGTGYSSLSHLSTLPIDCLKIDRSFVTRLETGSNESAVVRSIVLLGSSLGKSVVAEGIETPAQLAMLREMGCRLGQGFLLARPVTAQEAAVLLNARPQCTAMSAAAASMYAQTLVH